MPSWLDSLLGNNKTIPKSQSVFKEIGVSGVSVYGGFILDREQNPKLSGPQKYITFEELAQNVAIVAASIRLRSNLVAKAKWSVEMVDEDLPGSQEAKEFAERLMEDHDGVWSKYVRQSAMFRFNGASFSEWTARKAEDGAILLNTIEPRPMRTIQKFDLDLDGNLQGVWQSNNYGAEEFYIPRWTSIYLADNTISDAVDGSGLLRHVVESCNRLKNYLSLETTGYERDLRGSPIGFAPIDAINKAVANGEVTKEEGQAALQGIIDLVTAQRKGQSTGAVLDSSVYTGTGTSGDGKQVSSVKQWGIELLQGGASGLADMAKAIERINYEIARTLGTEGLMLGSSSVGSQALSTDKTGTLHDQINADNADVAAGYTRDLLVPFCNLNGIDPKLVRFKVEEISGRDATEAVEALKGMVAAGAAFLPEDPIFNAIRIDLGYDPQPEDQLVKLEEQALQDAERQAQEFDATMAQMEAAQNGNASQNSSNNK